MDEPQQTPGGKPSLLKVGLISFCLCFLVGECTLRTVLYRTVPAMFVPSDQTTFRLAKSGRFRHKALEFDVTYGLAKGWRGPAPRVDKGQRKRIVLLGDSFCFGHGVGDEETVARQLQDMLGDGYEVINGGYRAGKSYDDAHAWFVAEGASLKPDAVVFLSYSLNDFADVADNEWTETDSRGAPLAVRGGFDRPNALGLRGPLHPADEHLFHRSEVLRVLWRRILAPYVMAGPSSDGPKVKALSTSRQRMDSELFRAAYARGLLAIEALDQRVQAAGGVFQLYLIRPILSLAPDDDVLKAWNGAGSVAMEDYDPSALNKALQVDLATRGVPTLYGDGMTLEDFYRSDAHWRASGHKKAAEAISRWLKQTVLR